MDPENQHSFSLRLTKAALTVWDEGHAAREERWQNALTTTDLVRCARLDKKEALPVQQAFFQEATPSMERRLVEPDDVWLRFVVARHG